jgi:hypothetical protein
VFILIILYGVIGLPLRMYYMKKTCDECDFHSDWKSCDGMKFLKEIDP